MSIPDLIATVNRALFEHWDPIGVRDHPGWPRDEYEGYAAGVLAMVLQHASDEVVAEYLGRIEEQWMGLARSPLVHRVAVARRIRVAIRHARDPGAAG